MLRRLQEMGYRNLLTRTRAELDLLDQRGVFAFFAEERPEFVVLSAAKVGGILANQSYPATFLYENLVIQQNVMEASRVSGGAAAAVSGIVMYLSADGAAADGGKLPAEWSAGADQPGVCSGKDCGSGDVLEL